MSRPTHLQEAMLRRFPFLAGLPDDERRNLLGAVAFRRLPEGDTALEQGSPMRDILFVLTGSIRVFQSSEDGREIVLYQIGAGEMCALTVVCLLGRPEMPSPVSAMAVQDTLVARVPADTFRYEYAVSPHLQQFVFRLLADKLGRMIGLVEQLTFHSVAERLSDYLRRCTDGGRQPLYATHAQLAASLGTSREVVTRRLREMERRGEVRTQRGKITLLNSGNPPDAE